MLERFSKLCSGPQALARADVQFETRRQNIDDRNTKVTKAPNPRVLPGFRLANGNGRACSFEEFLADNNVIMLTLSEEASHDPGNELLRSFVAEGRRVEGVTVRGFDIRMRDASCNQCRGPHVVFQGRELVTVCDSGGLVRRLWGIESDAWILIVDADRNVLDEGPLAEIERLSAQFDLGTASSSHGDPRAPP